MAVFPWQSVLDYWFGASLSNPATLNDQAKYWFQANAVRDREVQRHFGEWLHPIAQTKTVEFVHPDLLLAGVLVLDQFPRHIFRGKAEAYAFDDNALGLLDAALGKEWDRQLHPLQAAFLYMPLQHCENKERQEQSVALYEKLSDRTEPAYAQFIAGNLDYARQHQQLIERFGRFPHRNAALGRESSHEELEYLARDGRRFGQ